MIGGSVGLLRRLLGKNTRRAIDDPDFGRIEEREAGSWEGQAFQLWGHFPIQVLIDAGPGGPSAEQRSFLEALRLDPQGIRAKIEAAVSLEAGKTSARSGSLKMTSVFIPAAPSRQMWRVWYDMEGEDHYSYGAEIVGWDRVIAFTED